MKAQFDTLKFFYQILSRNTKISSHTEKENNSYSQNQYI